MQNLPNCGLETIPRDRETSGKNEGIPHNPISVCAYLFLDFPRLNHSTFLSLKDEEISLSFSLSLFLSFSHFTFQRLVILLLLSTRSDRLRILQSYQIILPFQPVARVKMLLRCAKCDRRKRLLSKRDKHLRVTRVITVSIASSLPVICSLALHLFSR